MSGPLAGGKRFIKDREGAFDIASAGFDLGKRRLDESVEEREVLLAKKFDAAAHGS